MRKGRLEDKKTQLTADANVQDSGESVLALPTKKSNSKNKKGQTTRYQEFGTSDILGNCVRNNSRSPRFDKRQHKLTIKNVSVITTINWNHLIEMVVKAT